MDADALELVGITAADAVRLASFECARPGEPWSDVVEIGIRSSLVPELQRGSSSSLGLVDGDRLAAVAAFRLTSGSMAPNVCFVVLLGVATDYQRRGYGRRLKEKLLTAARSAGAVAVSSRVDRRNAAMLSINRDLGAVIEPIDGNADDLLCTIPL